MSMYTHLLHAAIGERALVTMHPSSHSALNAVRRCHRDLAEDVHLGTDPDAVPVVLAREIAYDIALMELATVMGVETDVERFEQPRQERARLEHALRERGVSLPESDDAPESAPLRA